MTIRIVLELVLVISSRAKHRLLYVYLSNKAENVSIRATRKIKELIIMLVLQ